jgi:hypothetical protein
VVCVDESNIVGEEAQLGIRKQRLLQRKQERVGVVLQGLLEELLQVEAGGPLERANEDRLNRADVHSRSKMV